MSDAVGPTYASVRAPAYFTCAGVISSTECISLTDSERRSSLLLACQPVWMQHRYTLTFDSAEDCNTTHHKATTVTVHVCPASWAVSTTNAHWESHTLCVLWPSYTQYFVVFYEVLKVQSAK